jgi:type IV conjugative transfer system coupling protein TraD
MTAHGIRSVRPQSSVRGTELFFNNLRMAISAIKSWMAISLCVSLLFFFLAMYFVTEIVEYRSIACASGLMANGNFTVSECFENGALLEKASWAASGALAVFALTCYACWRFLRRMGHRALEDKFIRGSKLALVDDLKEKIQELGLAGPFSVAGVPILKSRETEHLVIVGATGSGKSVAIKELLDQVRAEKQRAVIYDVSGEFVSTYFNPETDVILNPLDVRCPAWSPWVEASTSYAMDSIAASLIPENRDDSFRVNAARALFSGIANQLVLRKECTNERLFHYAAIAPLSELQSFLEGTPAGTLIDPSSEATASSIRAVLTGYLGVWPYLKETDNPDNPDSFSIRNFIANDDNEGFLFLTSRADQHDLLKPILSCWLSLCINATLSLPESRERRIWFFLDELASLHRVKIADFLERARKHGGAAVLGMQATSQLQSIYGKEDASSLLQNCKTGLYLQVSDADTAKSISAMCGNQEILEGGENQRFTRSYFKDGANLSRNRVVRPVVLDAELLNLQKLEGYLRLPDDWPITKIKLGFKDRPKLAEAFVARD